MSATVGTHNAISKEGVPLTVEGTALFKIGSDDEAIVSAAERYLGRPQTDIQTDVQAVLEGSLRSICGRLTPEEIYRDPTSLFSATFVGGRNRIDLPVSAGRVSLGAAFDVAAPATVNGRATALIAPEDVVIGGPNETGLPATVRSRTFHGATTRLALAAEIDGRPILVTAEVPSRVATELADDSAVTLRVAPDHVRLFPA